MKCDHIRTRAQGDTPFFPNMLNNANVEVCLKEDVDAAIAELKAENERLEKLCQRYRSDCDNIAIREAKQLRATRRALWIARAERAMEKIAWFKLWNSSISTMNPEDGARQEYDKWKKVLGKCLKKAEEYKRWGNFLHC